MRSNDGARLLAELERWADRTLTTGTVHKGSIDVGDVELEITVRVRRRAAPDAITEYRAAALALLAEPKPSAWYRAESCECHLKPRAAWLKYGARCTGRVVAAIVYQTSHPTPHFLFICGRHRENHGIDPKAILAVIELPPSQLGPILERARVERQKHEARLREEDAAREAAARARVRS